MKIAIYYICTGLYNKYFNAFIESLTNFFPDANKHVILMSDEKQDIQDIQTENNITITYYHINHYPWPIIALYKHWHILQHFDETCDYHCYFNANSIIHKNNPELWCDLNKLNASFHSFSNIPDFLFPPNSEISKESCAYLPTYSYKYLQDAFFFGPSKIFKEMCEDIVEMINIDSKKQIYAKWHDESYFNKWCENNYEKVNRQFIMNINDKFINETTFIKLPLKSKEITNVK